MTLDAKRLWVVCKTLGKLPNDPLVADLTDIQVEWILWNARREAEEIDDVVNGSSKKNMYIESAKDVQRFTGLYGGKNNGLG